MDAYPEDYITHNLPLIVLHGLGQEPAQSPSDASTPLSILEDDGPQLSSDLPSVDSEAASQLRDCFLEAAGSNDTRHGIPESRRAGSLAFRVKIVGRVGMEHPSSHKVLFACQRR